MTITMIPLECGAPEACENPNPAVAEHAVCCLIATAGDRCSSLRKKAPVAVDADLAFPVIFSKRCAWGCPNWAALLMGYFESPYSWEIKLG